jgi:hypothetical protein
MICISFAGHRSRPTSPKTIPAKRSSCRHRPPSGGAQSEIDLDGPGIPVSHGQRTQDRGRYQLVVGNGPEISSVKPQALSSELARDPGLTPPQLSVSMGLLHDPPSITGSRSCPGMFWRHRQLTSHLVPGFAMQTVKLFPGSCQCNANFWALHFRAQHSPKNRTKPLGLNMSTRPRHFRAMGRPRMSSQLLSHLSEQIGLIRTVNPKDAAGCVWPCEVAPAIWYLFRQPAPWC